MVDWILCVLEEACDTLHPPGLVKKKKKKIKPELGGSCVTWRERERGNVLSRQVLNVEQRVSLCMSWGRVESSGAWLWRV